MADGTQYPQGPPRLREAQPLLSRCPELLNRLYAESNSKRWGLTPYCFAAALERSARKRFPNANPHTTEIVEFLNSLHLEDLALACACAEGLTAAWEEFVVSYRGYLRAAAAAILRCSVGAPEANELADSLFAELYGLTDGKRAERSLFRYFHGRSSLRTWLRAVLAQRCVDALRASKKFDSFDVPDGETKYYQSTLATKQDHADPYRAEYLKLFRCALQSALGALEPGDLECLRLYYAEENTLAQIARLRGEHESSVSRHLERIRRAMRLHVEEILRSGSGPSDGSAGGKGLSEEQMALCFEYAAEDAPIDLDQMLKERKLTELPQQRRKS